jgi:hypothetical protein
MDSETSKHSPTNGREPLPIKAEMFQHFFNKLRSPDGKLTVNLSQISENSQQVVVRLFSSDYIIHFSNVKR